MCSNLLWRPGTPLMHHLLGGHICNIWMPPLAPPLEAPKPPHSRRLSPPLHCIGIWEGFGASALEQTSPGWRSHTHLWSNNIQHLWICTMLLILWPREYSEACRRRPTSHLIPIGEGGGGRGSRMGRRGRIPAAGAPRRGGVNRRRRGQGRR